MQRIPNKANEQCSKENSDYYDQPIWICYLPFLASNRSESVCSEALPLTLCRSDNLCAGLGAAEEDEAVAC